MPKNAPEGPKAPIHAENQLFHEMAANKSPGKIRKIEKSDKCAGKMKSRDAAGPEGSATNKRKHRRRQSQIVEETFKTV